MVSSKSQSRRSSGRARKTAVVGVLGCAGFYGQSLLHSLRRDRGLAVVDLQAEGKDPLAGIDQSKPDVILVDTSQASAIELVLGALEHSPTSKVIALSAAFTGESVLSLLEAGISGLVTREGSLQDLRAAIHDVVRGGLHVPAPATAALLEHLRQLSAMRPRTLKPPRFTQREMEVLPLLEQHLTNKQIAARLGIHPDTVKSHVHNILAKAGVHKRGDIVAPPEK